MRKTPHDRVADDTHRAALLAPPIRVDDAALQHGPAGLEQLADGVQAELVEAAEGREIGVAEGSVGHVEVFRTVSVRTSILGRPRPRSGTDAPTSHPYAYTLNCESPISCRSA